MVASAFVIATSFVQNDVAFLASLFSFGVLLAFTAAQLAVIKLRIDEPDLPRPYRAPFNVRIRGAEIPLPAIVGSIATFAVWIDRDGDAPGRALRRPALARASGSSSSSPCARSPRRGPARAGRRARRASRRARASTSERILVPMKLGIIGEEMLATAVKLASEHGAEVQALHVIRVPLEQPLDAPMLDEDGARRGVAGRGEAARRGLRRRRSRARPCAPGRSARAIVEQAAEVDADLIVLGSAPRWRRQSRFFSPTVDYVLRSAPVRGADRRVPAVA